jgi:DNA mismatch repair protein MutL
VGRETAGELLPITWEAGELHIHGLVSSPAVGRSGRDRQFFFFNRRPIRSGLLAVMLERPYAARLPPGRYPLAALFIELDPALVDVNVHPRKAEVRFAQERAVYGAVGQAVGAALAPFPLPETAALGAPGWPFPETPSAPALVGEAGVAYEIGRRAEALGQVQNTYVVARTFDGLVVVDQHAAHEAVLTEQLLAAVESVPLSPPVRLDLTTREAELLSAHLDLLADLGLEAEPFGRNSFLVRTLPAPLAGQELSALLTALLAELAASRGLDPDAEREMVAARAACQAAAKAGDRLTTEQQQALLDELLAAWSPSVCPHGRPVLFALSVEEMERRFLRR